MSTHKHQLGPASLLASGVGTAFACVCLLGLTLISRTAPGVWSLIALGLAALLCRVLAVVFADLVQRVPSGAGMFAFVARAWGPAAGVVVVAPYVVLMILLGALESLIIGHLLAPHWHVPPVLLAGSFLLLLWWACRRGWRFGFGLQQVTTALLVAGVLLGAVHLLQQHGWQHWLSQWQAAPPSWADFVAATAQAIFLFMGFELLCVHIESTDVSRIAWSLKTTVWLLALIYGVVLLALSGSAPTAAGDGIAAILPIAPSALNGMAFWLFMVLCLLAAATSLNGAFLGLSRLIAVLASQKVLPPGLAAIHGPTLMPRAALLLLLGCSLGCVLLIDWLGIFEAVMLAAATSAALLYAIALLIRGQAPYHGADSGWRPWLGRSLAAVLALVAVGVVLAAERNVIALISLLGVTYGAGWLAALRLRRNRKLSPRTT